MSCFKFTYTGNSSSDIVLECDGAGEMDTNKKIPKRCQNISTTRPKPLFGWHSHFFIMADFSLAQAEAHSIILDVKNPPIWSPL